MNETAFPVFVRCSTFNHAKFIENAMDGFTMQQTDFPYVCAIIDDASTDGEPEVISRYLQEHFDLADKSIVQKEETDDYKMIFSRHKSNTNCYFAVYYLKYNHYSLNKDNYLYASKWLNKAKCYGICEGDDYWIDKNKLQKQFDYMENHPDCTMVCNRAKLYSERKKKFIGEQYCRHLNGELSPVDVINRTGLYIPTCSIIYRPEIKNDYPDYCDNCNVGDYPLQITAAMKGYIYYFDSVMSVYRIDCEGSWSNRQKYNSIDSARLQVVHGQAKMFEGFANDYPVYKDVFLKKRIEHVIKNTPLSVNGKDKVLIAYKKRYSDVFMKLPLCFHIYYIISRRGGAYFKILYQKTVLRKYRKRNLYYDGFLKRASSKLFQLNKFC